MVLHVLRLTQPFNVYGTSEIITQKMTWEKKKKPCKPQQALVSSTIITYYTQRVSLHVSLFYDLTAYDYGVDNSCCTKLVFKIFDSHFLRGLAL